MSRDVDSHVTPYLIRMRERLKTKTTGLEENMSIVRDRFSRKLTLRFGMLNGQHYHRIFHKSNFISGVTKKNYIKIIP